MPQHKYFEQMSKRYGKVYGNVGLTNRSLVINDPELIHEVLVDRFNEFPDRFPWHFGSPKLTKSLAGSMETRIGSEYVLSFRRLSVHLNTKQ